MQRALAGPMLLLLLGSAAAHAVVLKGRLEWVHKVEMRVLENGVVEEVAVTAGDHVKRGQLLLRMDRREFRAALLEAKAGVARARINTEDAVRELTRSEELFERGLIAQEELKDAELKQAAAVAEEESAKAAETVAALALERAELRAPFDGIVVERNAWHGAVVYKTLQSAPLVAVAPDDRMLARALVTADLLRRYRPGQRGKVNIGGELRDARVYSLGVEAVRVDLKGAVYELDLIFKRRADEILRPSESAQIILP
jgi:RND family efflux transporter MFP subunit